MIEADTIVVGGGSAGAVLAGMLAEKSDEKILLLEAGGSDRGPITQVPLGLTQAMHNPRFDWRHESAPHAHLGGAVAKVPRGKVMGGSGSINSMLYIRGRKSDYDEWAAAGATGWDGEAAWKNFDALEQHVVSAPQRSPHPLGKAFVAAGEAIQLPKANDFNERQEGLGHYRVNMCRGKRWTGVDAFLRPAQKTRPNLAVRQRAEVETLTFDGPRVTGARLTTGETLTAHRRLILSAGAIATPRLLMRSGYHHRGLGKNLQDHAAAALVYGSQTRGHGLAFRNLGWLANAPFAYLARRAGLLSSPTVEAGGFARTRPDLAEPDVQFHFGPFNLSYWGHGYFADVCVLKPKSRGEVSLDDIDLNLLSHPDDLETLERGYALLQRILSKMGADQDRRVFPDGDLADAVRRHAATAYHPVGTAKMGTDPLAVVDPLTLLVRGLDNVAVVDASLMPTIPAGNTNNPTMMMAYRAAKEIL